MASKSSTFDTRHLGFTSLTTPPGYNPKLNKGLKRGYASLILHLAPARLSGYEVCRARTAGCTASCLNTAGHGGIVKRGDTTNEVQRARIARTKLFFQDRPTFATILIREIETHIRRARKHGLTPVVRLNGTSDLPWEVVKLRDGLTVFELFPDVTFYDYTKVVKRALRYVAGEMPANYSLTFSLAESNREDALAVLAAGGNVAAVFLHGLPAQWAGVPVVDGDTDDLRFLDPRGCVVGLKAKGKAKRDTSGFVLDGAPRAA